MTIEVLGCLDQLREALVYKSGDSNSFIACALTIKFSPINIIKQPDCENFFSIQTRDNADLFEGVKEWSKDASIEVHADKYEIYYDGSLITKVESTMQQTYDKLTLENIVRLFRSMDELF